MVYTLNEIKTLIKLIAVRFGFEAVYVFGSYAKGTARFDSEIDILVIPQIPI